MRLEEAGGQSESAQGGAKSVGILHEREAAGGMGENGQLDGFVNAHRMNDRGWMLPAVGRAIDTMDGGGSIAAAVVSLLSGEYVTQGPVPSAAWHWTLALGAEIEKEINRTPSVFYTLYIVCRYLIGSWNRIQH